MTTQINVQSALADVFGLMLARIKEAPESEAARVLAEFASSLLNGEAFDLSRLDRLAGEDDQGMCLSLLNYCMSVGLTEDERREASEAFAPYVEIHQPGTRH